jgi:hypothetical protein
MYIAGEKAAISTLFSAGLMQEDYSKNKGRKHRRDHGDHALKE